MRLRLALALCLGLAACSSGDSGNTNTVPSLPWGLFRHDTNNSGSGNSITQNRGEVRLVASNFGGVGPSTPTVDKDSNVYLGTRSGIVSITNDGKTRWQLATCAPEGGTAIAIGSVSSSLTVQAGGNIVFGSDADVGPGAVFYVTDENDHADCKWAFATSPLTARSGVRSSAQVQIDPNDLSLLSVFIGADNGYLHAINGIGTPRWTFPAGVGSSGPITSTPAVGINSVTYVTTPDGLLLAVDSAGQALLGTGFPFPIGVPPLAALQQSASVDVSVYAIGAGGALFAINPNGTLKWQYAPQADVLGSQSFISESVDEGSQTVFDTIVYIVDQEGTLYGVRDDTGQLLEIQRCSSDLERSCRMDSCDPGEGTCMSSKCSIGACSSSGQECSNNDDCSPDGGTCTRTDCTPDSCIADKKGECVNAYPGTLSLTGGAAVDTSPVVSGDLFAIVGTADGRVCARGLDTTVPGDKDNPSNPWLVDGCIDLGDGLPVLSSPAIGPQSRIYVTTATGLYVIE